MRVKRLLCSILALAMVLSTMSFSAFAEEVSEISDGDYIYFGNDESNKWLVLDADKNSMGEDGMFLVLANPTEKIIFNSEKNNSWEESNAQAWCEQYVEDHFAEWENDAVISTTKTEKKVTWWKTGEAESPWVYGENTITDAKLFFLSLQEAAEYKLVDSIGDVTDYGGFWLRSPQIQQINDYGTDNETTTDSNPNVAAVVNTFGTKGYGSYDPRQESFLYARPAFNLNTNNVKSATKGDDGVWTLSLDGEVIVENVKVKFAPVDDGAPNSYEITLAEGETFPEGGVTITFPAVEGADDGDPAYVVHEHDGTNYIYVGKVADGSVTITNKVGFSAFTVYAGGLADAIAAAEEGDIIYLMGEINEGSIKLPATITNLTIDGQNTAIVKDTTINAADGNSVNYQGLTIKNTTFDNSRFVLGGMRNGDVIYKDLVFDNNKFINIVNTASMAAVHMNLDSEDNEYIENFTFTNNLINGVTGSNNSGVLLKSITGDVVFEGNTVSNVAWNAVQVATAKADAKLVVKNNSFASSGSSVLNIAAAPSAILENNTIVNDSGRIGLWYPAEAKIGDVLYIDIQTAINNAKDSDTIVLMSDIEAEVNPTADSINTADNCLIYTDKDDVITLDLNGKTISVKGSDEAKYDTLAIRNNGNLTIVDNGNAGSAGTISLAFDGTQESGTSQIHSTILNFGTLTINGGNIINTATTGYARHAIYNYSWGGNANLTVKNGYISSVGGNAIFQAIYDDLGKNTNNVTIEDGTFNGGVYSWYQGACAPDGASLTIKGGEFIGENYALRLRGMASAVLNVDVQGGTFTAPAGVDAITSDAAAGFISGGTFSSNVSAYAADGFDVVRTADKYVVEAESEQADSISIEYKDVTSADAEGEKTYEVIVKANDDDMINELASVDLTFVYTSTPVTGGNIDFTVAPATDFTMTRYENTNRYMFNYNGVTASEGTAKAIPIATITVTGYGEYTIATDAADTNIVNATTVNDNLVDSYTAAGAEDDDATTGALVINNDTVPDDGMVGEIKDGEIAVPVRTLTINLDFPNAVVDNAVAYQDMKVEITGNIDGVNKTVTYNLGTDEVAMADGSYVVTDENLVLNNAYTVTVSGAGYRTARYTVTMTEDKTLRFWNNVMDEAQFVEIGKESSKVNITFLAGDIVKDNNINIYDLSAVVSYFGTENCVNDYPEYAKYDLNRDGVIDSKDVAYVLVSWDK